MSKRNKIIYWIATGWFCLSMVSTGIVQLFKIKNEGDFINHLGYPAYILQFIGFCKMLGIIALLFTKFSSVKDWAYAGFFFLMTGAVYSHIANGDNFRLIFPSLFSLLLLLLSWYFRPVKTSSVSTSKL
ncbi:DoxX family protein [Flavihumibacter sp. UBA7668]|uniref:DoxX family protein n=1 Tax=Flavihumibacter sp. UBA7668 TaxID=1946542 RepID=UPI0025BD5BC6|nr:DoxX family protein [Flavihumibacter sp. UBA7668]